MLLSRIVQSSGLNSFSSICYCVLTLGIHSYASYTAVRRYQGAESREWPGGGSRRSGTPVESGTMLGLTVLSLVLMPVFCLTCVFKVGNLANDGVKLGRDHALGTASDTTKDCSTRSRGMRRLWKVACPISQTIHVVAAFLILLPETLLTSVEIKFGYKSTGEAWRSDLDFLYPTDRSFFSEVRSSFNASLVNNASHVLLDTSRVAAPVDAGVVTWGDRAFDVHVSIAFANFCLALGCFLVRYASVFWYTNKPLAGILAVQLLATVLTSVFSFGAFSTLYCVGCNKSLYPNAAPLLRLRCGGVLVLYLLGGTVLLASSVVVFEYGCHYFHEKFDVVARHRGQPESLVKRALESASETAGSGGGCQGYLPHLCAIGTLVLSVVFKAPLLYDLVNLMRLTSDQMLLSGIVCEVCYMVLWLALWLGLTLKQQWQFRILDYVALQPGPIHTATASVVSDDSARSQQGQQPDHGDSLTRSKRLSGREEYPPPPQRFLDPPAGVGGINSSCDELPCSSDLGTDESDGITSAAEMVLDLEGNPTFPDRGSNFRRNQRAGRAGGQRVTFDDSVRTRGSSNDEVGGHGGGAGNPMVPRHHEETNQLNVMADVHSSSETNSSNTSNESSHRAGVIMRQKPGEAGVSGVASSTSIENGPLSREYRNSIRNKCGELYSSTANLTSSSEEAAPDESVPPPCEPLPTLMSSFRDKVRESSLAASTFRERERHMLEQFDYLDAHPRPAGPHTGAAVLENTAHTEVDKRRAVTVTDSGPDAARTNSLDRHSRDAAPSRLGMGDGPRYSSERYRPRSKSYDQSQQRTAEPGEGGGRCRDHHVSPDSANDETYDYRLDSSSSLPRSKAAGHNSSLSSDEGHRSSFSEHASSELSLTLPPAMEDLQHGRTRLGSGLARKPADVKDNCIYSNHHSNHPRQFQPHHPHTNNMVGGNSSKNHLVLNPRPLQVLAEGKMEIKRRDSANYSLTSSQETSSNESDQGHGLCSQV